MTNSYYKKHEICIYTVQVAETQYWTPKNLLKLFLAKILHKLTKMFSTFEIQDWIVKVLEVIWEVKVTGGL